MSSLSRSRARATSGVTESYLAGRAGGQTPLDADEADGLIPSWVATRADLDRVEQEGVARAIGWSRGRRLQPHDIVDEPFVRQLHKRMFGNVWRWAGHYRRTNKNIGVEYPYITEEIGKLVADARHWLAEEDLVADEAAVRFHHRLVLIHPFPNGNGRHARLAADLLLTACGGGPLTWGRELAGDPGSAPAEYVAALREADAGDVARLLAFARR